MEKSSFYKFNKPGLYISLSFSQPLQVPNSVRQDIAIFLEQAVNKSGFGEANVIIFAEKRAVINWAVKLDKDTIKIQMGKPSENEIAMYITPISGFSTKIPFCPPPQGIEANATISIDKYKDQLQAEKMLDRGVLIVFRIINTLKRSIINDQHHYSKSQETRLWLEAIQVMNSPINMRSALHAIMQLLVDMFNVRCALFFIDSDENTLIPLVGAGGFDPEDRRMFKSLNNHRLFQCHFEAIYNNNPFLISPNAVKSFMPTDVYNFFKPQWVIVTPLTTQDNLFGILQVDRAVNFKPEEVDIVFAMSKICTTIIENDFLKEKIQSNETALKTFFRNIAKQKLELKPPDHTHSSLILESLTPRELEILKLIVQGLTNKEAAGHLNISINTVKAHINSVYRKLNVNNRTQAILRSIHLGINKNNHE